MIFVIISSNHNLSATLLPQPFPPSSSPSSRLRCGVGCPLVDCRELSAAKAARCLNPPRAHHVGDWKQEMPSCFVFSGSTNRRSGFTIFLLIVDRFSESFVWGNLKTKQTRFARKGVQTRTSSIKNKLQRKYTKWSCYWRGIQLLWMCFSRNWAEPAK